MVKEGKGGAKAFFFFLFYLKIYSVLWSAFLQSAFIIVVLRSFQICSIRWLKPRIKNLKVEVQKGNFNISKYMFFRKLSCFWKKKQVQPLEIVQLHWKSQQSVVEKVVSSPHLSHH